MQQHPSSTDQSEPHAPPLNAFTRSVLVFGGGLISAMVTTLIAPTSKWLPLLAALAGFVATLLVDRQQAQAHQDRTARPPQR